MKITGKKVFIFVSVITMIVGVLLILARIMGKVDMPLYQCIIITILGICLLMASPKLKGIE
ncbi:MAG: hypothetical protein E7242_00520 [Lachnospiraceae bacterium]|nr:hypothetical protein [Lachnospiraceae bacterium]